MSLWDDPGDRVAIAQMNSDVRHAQVDLRSAQCATDRLRENFSVEDVARYGEKDSLRKAINSAVAVHDFFESIQRAMTAQEMDLSEALILKATNYLFDYLWSQREEYIAIGASLPSRHKQALLSFFSPALLERVRIVELRGRRIPPPPFYQEAQAAGIENLPELTHMASLTFIDVIVFSDQIDARRLFHGLIHATQFYVLGMAHCADLFVRAFLRTGAHFMVPLESHAFSMEAEFAVNPGNAFSVEERVRSWMLDGRY